MKKLILSLGFLLLSVSFSPTSLFSSAILSTNPGTQVKSDGYIYVKVYENGKWYIYVYESDGVTLVTIIEEEW